MMGIFDIIIIAMLILAILMLLTGNEDRLMGMMSGRQGPAVYDVYEREPFNKACLIFCIVLLLNELGILFIGSRIPKFNLISLGITIADFVIFFVYIRKHRR